MHIYKCQGEDRQKKQEMQTRRGRINRTQASLPAQPSNAASSRQPAHPNNVTHLREPRNPSLNPPQARQPAREQAHQPRTAISTQGILPLFP